MTLKKKRLWFTMVTSVVLILLFSIVTIQSFSYFSRDTIREQGRMAAEMLRISLTEQMRTGVIGERNTLFKRLRTIPGLDDVRVVRGEPVIRQFGPGIEGEQVKLEMEKRVLATGQWEERFFSEKDKRLYQITIPYIARSTGSLNCLQCHQVPEGTINGVVTLGFSLENMRHSELFAILPLIVLLVVFGLCLGYFLKRLFAPMVVTVEELKSVVGSAIQGDFSGRITSSSKDEIGEIAKYTNILMDTLDQSMGRISDRIQSLGGHRRSDGGEKNLLNHTVRMVDEMVGATRFKQAVENDLDLNEIYGRIRHVLKEHFGLHSFSYYQVEEDDKHLALIFAEGLQQESELWCDPEILMNADACRAKRTASCVSSINNPHICPHFCGVAQEQRDMVHVCIPMRLSGRVGGVLQMVMTAEEAEQYPDIEQTTKLYLNQAAPVIEARQLMKSLKNTAMRDPMTGLYNRRFIEEYVDTLTASSLRQNSTLGVLMCDIDFFKQVNDNYGHDIGDMVIKELATILKKAARASDLAIRFGGEEFLLLLPDTDVEGCKELAERVRMMMEEHVFQTPQGPLKKTLSVGYSMFPEDGAGFWECVKYADIALYQAKDRGRNQTLHFQEDMRSGDMEQY
ncbi:sensor domain-containing diguanylate cyclase [Ghiorsea bivora]|uniref:sensor domain-containing diguanylate cyclase n=1 Tax=Ghiorsea bivora TaxID=1485545 RepID=UPI0005711965|nr:diguanylate cyclase [Ghiorsea bivora]